MRVSIVVPTIPGRERALAQTVEAYEWLTVGAEVEWIIERGHATCGAGWNAGAARATGDVLHLSADDLEPESAAWLPAALGALGQGHVPVGWVIEPTGAGRFGWDFCRVPTCLREWWQDVPEVHYYSDNAFTDTMTADGHVPVVAEGFDFIHRRSMVGRDESPERVERDRSAYLHQLPR